MKEKQKYCPFIKDLCRPDCVFYEKPLDQCCIYWFMSSTGEDFQTVQSFLYDIKHNTQND